MHYKVSYGAIPTAVTVAFVATTIPAFVSPAHAANQKLAPTPEAVIARLTMSVSAMALPLDDGWKFHATGEDGLEQKGLDDADWKSVSAGFQWGPENSKAWFRRSIVVPETIGGQPTKGRALRLLVGMDDSGEIYVDGALKQSFLWDDGRITLTEHAEPGQTFLVAVRGINGPGNGALHFARLESGALDPLRSDIEELAREFAFGQSLATALSADSPAARSLSPTMAAAAGQIDLASLDAGRLEAVESSLKAARNTLSAALTPITHSDKSGTPPTVYYVGHAHIDMNWLWTWPETIDVCHSTWDSAMKLMGAFPDFGFVQSQPGAYLAIKEQYPAEFSAMQAARKRGQWNLVGGTWDESDTNMPSGEGLARSLFLGQRFFKQNFGTYAHTGWLPDSFGHSWQMPQLLTLAGMENFYHMRCGGGIAFSWWESPDGSRVLKANTDFYGDTIRPDQMTRPWENQKRYGVKDALVVYGVGDHGGGPTRQMIEAGKRLQSDPVMPTVKFATADSFFDSLRKDLRAAPDSRLPILRRDLQYVFEGCYTTHAAMKAEVRRSENQLYESEVFASLAAIKAGRKYPVSRFSSAWQPTVFAQFHDIMCGSAIHSTYDWMHEQMKPALAFEETERNESLQAIRPAATGKETAILVSNSLSFRRDDIVRIKMPNAKAAAKYRSVRDTLTGSISPVQPAADDPETLVFIARGLPGLGMRKFTFSTDAPPIGITVADTIDQWKVTAGGGLMLGIGKSDGLIHEMIDQKINRSLFAPGAPGNVLTLLGDSGNAWDIHYTGEVKRLDTPDAEVSVVTRGPVFADVRVTRNFGAGSSVTQDYIVYNGLPRIDIPTTIEWHEHSRLLKAVFPLKMIPGLTAARVGIPFGSIERPTNGQENPGQKWMDVSERASKPQQAPPGLPVDLQPFLNSQSARSFDSDDRAYIWPADAPRTVAANGVGYKFFAPLGAGSDNIVCGGQTIPLPSPGKGPMSLCFLGAAAQSAQDDTITFIGKSGRRYMQSLSLGDWVGGGGASPAVAALTAPQRTGPKATGTEAYTPHLWSVTVDLPTEASRDPIVAVVLPFNPLMHVFALTFSPSAATVAPPAWGVTFLNDAKYGSDTNGSVFRLTLLRSPHDPDPNPDEGTHHFTYSLLPHPGDPRVTGHAEQAGLALNIPLRATLMPSRGTLAAANTPPFTLTSPGDDLILAAFKHAEDGPGWIVRLFETQGRNVNAHLTFDRAGVKVEETDILERPRHARTISVKGKDATFPVRHDQIVTLHITGLPDPGVIPPPSGCKRTK